MPRTRKPQPIQQWGAVQGVYHPIVDLKGDPEILISACREFYKGMLTIPVLRTTNRLKPGEFVTCTMTLSLMRMLIRRDSKTIKSLDVALRYGFRGVSRGRQNGIFFQRETDLKMIARTLQLVRKSWDEVAVDLLIDRSFESRPKGVELVKIVHHDPSGRRVVGVMYRTRIIFVGVASY